MSDGNPTPSIRPSASPNDPDSVNRPPPGEPRRHRPLRLGLTLLVGLIGISVAVGFVAHAAAPRAAVHLAPAVGIAPADDGGGNATGGGGDDGGGGWNGSGNSSGGNWSSGGNESSGNGTNLSSGGSDGGSGNGSAQNGSGGSTDGGSGSDGTSSESTGTGTSSEASTSPGSGGVWQAAVSALPVSPSTASGLAVVLALGAGLILFALRGGKKRGPAPPAASSAGDPSSRGQSGE